MYIREWGKGADKTALLIHGLASSSMAWHKLGPDLVKLGYHVIAPDLVGHGRSERKTDYSVTGWVEDILSLNLSPDLVLGHSMGGLIAAQVAATLTPNKTILLDPVLRLPSDEIILKGIQTTFTQIMKSHGVWNPTANRWNVRDQSVIKAGVREWDVNTAKALRPEGRKIASLLRSQQDVLLVRARGSYIVPSTILKRDFGSNIKVVYIKSARHNIHYDSYHEIWELMKHFIQTPVLAQEALVG